METPPTTPPPKPKRTRKPSTTKRVRQPKPQAILDLDAEYAAKKALYRLAQSSGGVLKRIRDKMLPRLTPEHRKELFDELSKTETPKLLDAPQAKHEMVYDAFGGAGRLVPKAPNPEFPQAST